MTIEYEQKAFAVWSGDTAPCREWDSIVALHGGTANHLYEWGQLIGEVHRHKLVYLVEDNGVLPLAYVRSLIFGKRLISLPFADYGGICAGNCEAAEALLKRALDEAARLKVDYLEIRSPDMAYEGIYQKYGLTPRNDYYTFRLSLEESPDVILADVIDKKHRTAIRKAIKSGVRLEEASSPNDVEKFYFIYLKTMKRLGSPPQPLAYFKRMWELFYPGRMKILFAVYEGRCIAAGLFLLYGNTILNVYSCSLKEYASLNPGSLVLWGMVQWGHGNGFKKLDFGRTRIHSGVWDFKKKWGGEPVHMTYFYKFYGRETGQRDEVKYKGLSGIWSRYLPGPIANGIGPYVISRIG